MTIERRRLRVYVAGPISTGDVLENVHRAVVAGRQLVLDGLAPYIPHLDAYMLAHNADPRATHGISWNGYLEWDAEWVKVSEAVYRLAGESKGADLEVKLALEEGIPIFYQYMHNRNPSPMWGYMELLRFADDLKLTGARR